MRGKKFKKEYTHHGTLRTQVVFERMKLSEDPYSGAVESGLKFKTWAEIYDGSFQDLESLRGRFSKNALALESIKSKAVKSYLTLKIRDPLSEFQPKNSDMVSVSDVRYSDKTWEVIDIRPDFYNRRYLIVHLIGG